MTCVVKICGLTTPRDVETAVRAGATAVGLVFATSPRRVDPVLAAELLAAARGVQRVAVFRVPTESELAAIAHLPFDAVQADGGWSGALPVGWFPIPAWRNTPEDLDALRTRTWTTWQGSLDGAFLLDGPRGGGLGERGDLSRAVEAARLGPCVLAGGLDADNVAEAVAAVRPVGVDVSSGVESAPGVKDPARIEAFVAAARAALAAVHGEENR